MLLCFTQYYGVNTSITEDNLKLKIYLFFYYFCHNIILVFIEGKNLKIIIIILFPGFEN